MLVVKSIALILSNAGVFVLAGGIDTFRAATRKFVVAAESPGGTQYIETPGGGHYKDVESPGGKRYLESAGGGRHRLSPGGTRYPPEDSIVSPGGTRPPNPESGLVGEQVVSKDSTSVKTHSPRPLATKSSTSIKSPHSNKFRGIGNKAQGGKVERPF